MKKFTNWFMQKISKWLMKEEPPKRAYLCDFDRISYEVRPGDVLLIEGRHRVSRIIRQITQSPWTHAALYIGRLHDIEDEKIRETVKKHTHCLPSQQLVLESLLGKGTVILPLDKYQHDHIRICRPLGLSRLDAQRVIAAAASHLGRKYNVRHIFDLARLLLPYAILPRRWRSSLFQHNPQQPTEDICSSVIAEAFSSVNYPVLPIIKEDAKGIEFIHRDPRLLTPSDFDYSPYFAIIKYPIFPIGQYGAYRDLPWKPDAISDDKGRIFEIHGIKNQKSL